MVMSCCLFLFVFFFSWRPNWNPYQFQSQISILLSQFSFFLALYLCSRRPFLQQEALLRVRVINSHPTMHSSCDCHYAYISVWTRHHQFRQHYIRCVVLQICIQRGHLRYIPFLRPWPAYINVLSHWHETRARQWKAVWSMILVNFQGRNECYAIPWIITLIKLSSQHVLKRTSNPSLSPA